MSSLLSCVNNAKQTRASAFWLWVDRGRSGRGWYAVVMEREKDGRWKRGLTVWWSISHDDPVTCIFFCMPCIEGRVLKQKEQLRKHNSSTNPLTHAHIPCLHCQETKLASHECNKDEGGAVTQTKPHKKPTVSPCFSKYVDRWIHPTCITWTLLITCTEESYSWTSRHMCP